MVSRSDAFEVLSNRAVEQRENLQTEEAAKTALVLPFIQALGYDIFDPTEVVPEFTADVGTKQGEKVDYAILREGEPTILFECKRVSDALEMPRVSQLVRYFNNTTASIGILTNGIVYRFFSDIEKDNIMDLVPFLEIDITKPDAREFNELNRFTKSSFDPEDIKSSASDMKYIRGIKAYLIKSFNQPDSEFVNLLARSVLPIGTRLTAQRQEHFTDLVRNAFHSFVADRINSTLRQAQESINATQIDDGHAPVERVSVSDATEELPTRSRNIETTVEEIEAYELVKVIVGDAVDPERVAMRDVQSYCGVLFDDNNRRPICHLLFNDSSRKRIRIFAYNQGVREYIEYSLDAVGDISAYAIQLRAVALHYASE